MQDFGSEANERDIHELAVTSKQTERLVMMIGGADLLR
jgi:hypothetical protein